MSYSRRDADFVRRIAASIEERGKSVWIDTEGIADTEVFPQAIRSAVEGADAFLFVITPSSVASDFCEQEVSYARTLEKRIVPVLRSPVPDPEIPEEIRNRTWIPFTEFDDYDASLERVILALDTDLQLRKEHTRWLVKAIEWKAEERDRSFLLHGSELKAAENWLARTPPDADPSPTTLQSEYVLASRRAAGRRQRTLLGASVVVTVVAVGLGVLALVSRNQAVSASTTARAQALAAESENELSADPEVSVLLARQAVQLLPIPQAVSALRQAIDASPVRLGLPTESAERCQSEIGPAIAFSPAGDRVAESLCTGDVVVLDAASGHIIYRSHLAAQSSAIAYDSNGRLLAVGTNEGIDLLDPSSGVLKSQLVGHGEPNALAFSPDGSLLAATTSQGATLWDLASRTARDLAPDSDGARFVTFTSDGQSLIVGAEAGFTAVFDVATGQMMHALFPPGQITTGSSPVAVNGPLLVVGTNVNAPGDVGGEVDLWDTETWTMADVLTSVTGAVIGGVAISPDGKDIAVGNSDGTGGVWSIVPDERLVSISGQTAALNSISFSPNGANVATASFDGTARIYRASGPWLATLPARVCECGNEIGWQPGKLVAVDRSGNQAVLRTWMLPSGREVQAPFVLSSSQQSIGSVLSPDGSRVALWNNGTTSTAVTVLDSATRRVVFTLPATSVAGVTFSNDDRLLAVADQSGGLHVSTLSNGRTLVGQGWPVECDGEEGDAPAVSSNDSEVAVFSFCGQVGIGRTASARPFEAFSQSGQLSRIAFNPDGNRLALGSWDSTVTVLNVTSNKPVLELVGDTRGVDAVSYSPNGHYLLTSSTDDTMRVWDAATGQLLQVDHDVSAIGEPSFSPDGQLVAGANKNTQIRVWAVCPDCQAPSGLLSASRSAVVSPLTPLERTEAAARDG